MPASQESGWTRLVGTSGGTHPAGRQAAYYAALDMDEGQPDANALGT